MKKKIAGTVLLFAAAVVAVALAFWSYNEMNNKLRPVTDEKKNVKVEEEVAEEVVQEQIQEEQKANQVAEAEEVAEEVVQEQIQEEQKANQVAEAENEQEAEEKTTEETSETVDPNIPVINLKYDQVEITAGEKFDLIAQVESITDDKDDSSWLFRSIHVGGEYNTKKPGEYILEYVVTDRDRNRSLPKQLKLIVRAKE